MLNPQKIWFTCLYILWYFQRKIVVKTLQSTSHVTYIRDKCLKQIKLSVSLITCHSCLHPIYAGLWIRSELTRIRIRLLRKKPDPDPTFEIKLYPDPTIEKYQDLQPCDDPWLLTSTIPSARASLAVRSVIWPVNCFSAARGQLKLKIRQDMSHTSSEWC